VVAQSIVAGAFTRCIFKPTREPWSEERDICFAEKYLAMFSMGSLAEGTLIDSYITYKNKLFSIGISDLRVYLAASLYRVQIVTCLRAPSMRQSLEDRPRG
jgi:hypothetical protein